MPHNLTRDEAAAGPQLLNTASGRSPPRRRLATARQKSGSAAPVSLTVATVSGGMA